MSLAETLHLLVQPLSSLSVWFIQLIILQLYEYYLNLHWFNVYFVLQDKCEHYWPDTANEPKQYGDIVVNLISVSNMDKFDINIFQVSQVRVQLYCVGLKSIIFYSLSYVFTSWIFSPFRVQSFLCSRRIVLSLMSNSKICHLNGDAKIWTFAWRLWPLTFKQGVNIVV